MAELSQAKQRVLNRFENRTDDWSFGEFETALKEEMGSRYGNYQTAKFTIIDADKSGKWPKTVARYVLTNFQLFGNSPGELSGICSRLFSSMSEEEKKGWQPKKS